MSPEHPRAFGGGASETTLNPIVLVAMVIAIILILCLPRKYIIVPLLFITFLIPQAQTLVLGAAHFSVSRIISLVGLVRLMTAGKRAGQSALGGGFNSIDSAFLWCTMAQACAVVILFASMPALINQAGTILDTAGIYFVLRFAIRDEQDMYCALKCLAVIAVIVAGSMVIEQVKQVNLFGFIGGATVPDVREGKVRCQGVFDHALLAGAFGATGFPLFLLLWKSGKAKFLGVLGALATTVITVTTNSSSPLLAWAAGILAVAMWPLRRKMRMVRWVIVLSIVALALVMKAPVWFVIAHIDLTGSSSGYHRAALIDQFIRHFSDWWLIGVKDAGGWGWDMWDQQNQYVNVGETGGLFAFVWFIVMISRCFGYLGKARQRISGDAKKEWVFWFLGAALFSHVVGFFGVNYFDQTRITWMGLLAIISAVTVSSSKEAVPCVRVDTVTYDWRDGTVAGVV